MKKLLLPIGFLLTFAIVSCRKEHPKPVKKSTIKIENVLKAQPFVESGTFKGSGNPPVILPGQKVSFNFSAAKGQAISFATMYGYSSDLFFAPENPGIGLFDKNGKPVEGDVSSQIKLWDDGTRINQKPGKDNPHTAAPDPDGVVMVVNGTDAQGFSYLPADKLMKVTLKYNGNSKFTLTIENSSGGTANETAFSPGVWAISNQLGGELLNDAPLYTSGQKSAHGLQPLAEMGDNSVLFKWVSDHTGIITPLSPVLVVVYNGKINPLFMVGEKDRSEGLADIAQKGDATVLQAALQGQPGVKHIYLLPVPKIGVLLPSIAGAAGGSVEQQIEYQPGDKITFATMFGYSNDWFFSFGDESILASANGDFSDKIMIWDDGTAVSQYPGAGVDQAAFGGDPASNPESDPIHKVDNTFPVPDAEQIIKVTISK
jgi:hypothetical protein